MGINVAQQSKTRWGRLLSGLMPGQLAIVLLLSFLVICITPYDAYGAASDHTRDDAVKYALSLQGSKHDVDNGSYDCVDIAKLYYSYLGEPVETGHAYTYTTRHLPNGWTRVYSDPQLGDVAAWGRNSGMSSYGHVGVVVNTSGTRVGVLDQSTGQQRAARISYYSHNPDCYLRPNFANGSHNPVGYLDSASGGVNSINVRGWTYDPDSTNESLQVHVYIGGPAGNGEGHVIYANVSRSDVNSVMKVSGNHGYDANISTSKSGMQEVYVYAINIGDGDNVLIDKRTVNIQTETEPPKISKVWIENLTTNGYRISCTVTDNVGVDYVVFPTWTDHNGQDDITWIRGNKSGSTYSVDVETSSHKNEHGIYRTHIYAYDISGNSAASGYGNSVLVPNGMANYGDSTYFLVDQPELSWVDAEKQCESVWHGGTLASITSAEEQKVIGDLVSSGNYNYYLIGASDAEKEGVWTWPLKDGVEQYENWASGEPNGGTSENYAVIRKSDLKWIDMQGEPRGDTGFIMETKGLHEKNGEVYTDLEEGIYSIKCFANSDYAVDVYGMSTQASENVSIYSDNGSDAQRFEFIKNDDGTYTIKNVHSGYVLDVSQASLSDGANVMQYPSHGGANQRWYIEQGANGCIYLRSKLSNLYLDVYGGVFENFRNLQTYHANGSAAQQFILKRAEHPSAKSRKIYDVTPNGYKVRFDINAPQGIKYVEFPTWTDDGGQDDIDWIRGKVDGSIAECEVKISDHGGNRGRYMTHVYVTDSYGHRYGVSSNNNIFVPTAVASWSTSTYFLVDAPLSWNSAQELSGKLSYRLGDAAHLATINSASEQSTLSKLVKAGAYSDYWIGATDAESEGDWKWENGESFGAYSNWAEGEPGGGAKENCAAIARDSGLWRDCPIAESNNKGFIVEFDNEDRVGPEVNQAKVESLDEAGFLVSFAVEDPSGVEGAILSAWAIDEGMDSATADIVNLNDEGIAYCRVNTADHGGKSGEYGVKVSARDAAGNESETNLDALGTILVPDAVIATDTAAYYRFDQPATWGEAQSYVSTVATDSMQLASITNELENESIAGLLAGAPQAAYWLGLTDAGSLGDFAWIDGAEMDYTCWAGGQPGKSNSTRYGAVLTSNSKWYAYANSGTSADSSRMGFIAKLVYTYDDADECEGEHTWGEWDTIEAPTCAEAGSRVHSCVICGYSEIEELDKLDHKPGDLVRENVRPATCTANGKYEAVAYCELCGDELSRSVEVLEKLGHDWGNGVETKSPTCTEAGSITFTCKRDSEHVRVVSTEPIGHAWGEWRLDSEPTLESDGMMSRVCENDPSHVETEIIPSSGHVHELAFVAAVAPTCDTNGNQSYYQCLECGLLFEDDKGLSQITGRESVSIKALGHDYTETVYEPTWDEDGYTLHKCSRCGDEFRADLVDSLATQEEKAVASVVDNEIASLLPLADLTLEDAAKVAAARDAYDALSDVQKGYVVRLDDLLAAESRMASLRDSAESDRVDAAAAKGVDDAISQLPGVDDLTEGDMDSVRAARKLYNALTDSQKALVERLDDLVVAEKRVAELQMEIDSRVAAAVDATIAALPAPDDLTLSDKGDVEAARKAYEGLTAKQKELVVKLSNLAALESKLDELQADADLAEKTAAEAAAKAEADSKAAASVDAAIATLPAIGDLVLSDKEKVESARMAYDALTDDQKTLVNALPTLESAEKRISELQSAGRQDSDTGSSDPRVDDPGKSDSGETKPGGEREGSGLAGDSDEQRSDDDSANGSRSGDASGVSESQQPPADQADSQSEGVSDPNESSLQLLPPAEPIVDSSTNPASGVLFAIAEAVVSDIPDVTFTGEPHTPEPIVTYGGRALVRGADYTLVYEDNVNAGTATVIVVGMGSFVGETSETFVIDKAENSLKAKAKTKTVKLGKAKRLAKAKTLSGAIAVSKKGQGKLTFTKVSKGSSKRLSVKKSSGKVVVAKGTPKGTYKMKVKVRAAGSRNHGSKTITLTVKVIVK